MLNRVYILNNILRTFLYEDHKLLLHTIVIKFPNTNTLAIKLLLLLILYLQIVLLLFNILQVISNKEN